MAADLGLFGEDPAPTVEDIALPDHAASEDLAAGAEDAIPEPRHNTFLLGHEATEQGILQDYNAGHMPHAIILSGPKGIGKATLAFRLARFLLSQPNGQPGGLFGEAEKPSVLETSPAHPVFKKVASGAHPDLKTLERKIDEKKGKARESISVEDARKIPEFLRLKPSEGGWRVVIAEDAEDLTSPAQNALLKILEEPPAQSILILTTSQPGGFLPTIRSRCRMIKMESLSDVHMKALLSRYAPDMTAYERDALIVLGQGSIGRALSLYREGGIELYEKMIAFLSELPRLKISNLHMLAEKLGGAGADNAYHTTFDLLQWWLSRMVSASARNVRPTAIIDGEDDFYLRLSGYYSPRDWMDIHDRVQTILEQSERSSLDRRMTILQAFQAMQK